MKAFRAAVGLLLGATLMDAVFVSGCGSGSGSEGNATPSAGTGATSGSDGSPSAGAGGSLAGAGGKGAAGVGAAGAGAQGGATGGAGAGGAGAEGGEATAGGAGLAGSGGANGGTAGLGGERDACTLGPSEPVLEEDVPARLAEVECGLFFACGCENAAERYPDEATCLAERTASYLSTQSSSRNAGYTHDAECARSFIQYVREVGCRRSVPTCLIPQCAFYNGSATGPCGSNSTLFQQECVAGSRCGFAGSTAGSMCGRIVPPLKTGDPCVQYQDCGYWALCPDDGGTCTARGLAGDACGTGLPACHVTQFCNDLGRCQRRASEGESCSDGVPCGAGVSCDRDSELCVPVGSPDVCSILSTRG